MSLTYGFFNSFNHDRRYSSVDISSMFDGLINDGIYKSVGDRFAVTQHANGANMSVDIGSGRAWFNHTWTVNSGTMSIDIDESDLILNRIDAIILEVNSDINVRQNDIKVIKGSPAENPVKPVLTNNADVHQYALAYVYVGAAVTEIVDDNIEDAVGTAKTPYVLGIVDVPSTIVNAVYPVGSIYMTVNAVNPGTIFTGTTWEEWGSGRVPIGVDKSNNLFKDPDYTGGSYTKSITPSGTLSGGAVQEHALTIDEMPSHRHDIGDPHYYTAAMNILNGLRGIHVQSTSSTYMAGVTEYTGQAYEAIEWEDSTKLSGNDAGHTHGFTPPTFEGTPVDVNVVQSYITCYMWKRTA